jgi:hypothetical protein
MNHVGILAMNCSEGVGIEHFLQLKIFGGRISPGWQEAPSGPAHWLALTLGTLIRPGK